MKNNKYISNSHKEKGRDDDNSIFSSDLSLLTDKQRALIESIRRDYLPQILKDQGLLDKDMRYESILMLNGFERLIDEMDFVLEHHQRTLKMEISMMKLWESYNNEIDPCRRAIIHEHFVAVQYYLSAYYFALTDKLKEMNTKYPITNRNS
jgi:hypothetical protein